MSVQFTARSRRSSASDPLAFPSRVALAVAVALCTAAACTTVPSRLGSLPARLSDGEFWELSAALSEPQGAFPQSDNLVSNETQFAETVQRLRPRGGVYIGVGPEQNFSYVARLRPAMAFIVDIRRENRNLHLMYKALFELAADRSDFVSHLFSRQRATGLGRHSSVDDLFSAYTAVPPSAALRDETTRQVHDLLVSAHRFPLSTDDVTSIEHALEAFRADGPEIHYGHGRQATAVWPSYRSLMTARDFWRRARSYLASEESFTFVKDLHARNLIVPVVGDFAGPSAIRRIGEYVRQHGAGISAFYSSNVEVYLSRDELRAFCGSLETLPYDADTWFLGSRTVERLTVKLTKCASVPPSLRWPAGVARERPTRP
jgi:hypothetical protein